MFSASLQSNRFQPIFTPKPRSTCKKRRAINQEEVEFTVQGMVPKKKKKKEEEKKIIRPNGKGENFGDDYDGN